MKSFKYLSLEEKYQQAKEYVENNYKDKYEFIDAYYKNTHKGERRNGCNEYFIKLKCKRCNGIFERKYCVFSSKTEHIKNDRCYCCVSYNQNSFLHSQICLMAERYYPNSKREKDIGFKGEKGYHPSKYDLYIPNHKKYGNLLIEFQSRFHDYKQEFDIKKQQYSIDKGFNFMSFDERKNNINDISILLFDKIVDEDIQKNYLKKPFDFIKAQEMLDKNIKIKDIAKEINTTTNIIQNYISKNILHTRKDRMEYTHGKTRLIRIDENLNIQEYESAYQYLKLTNKKVATPKHNTMIYSQGYYWLRKEDYISGNYILNERCGKIKDKIQQLKNQQK